MKIRTGFVSNSSSSSFILLVSDLNGIDKNNWSENEIKKELEELYKNECTGFNPDDEYDMQDLESFVDNAFSVVSHCINNEDIPDKFCMQRFEVDWGCEHIVHELANKFNIFVITLPQ